MEFGWSDAQCELYERSLELARSLGPGRSGFDRKRWQTLGGMGLLGLSVPEEYGGMGLDVTTTARVVEAFGRGAEDTGLIFSACAHLFAAAMPIAEHGVESLKRRLLPALASGECIGANAITEPDAGSDALALKARAERRGDEYVLNGDKSFVTNGPVADALVVYASTAPEHGYLGVSAFVVERGAHGVAAAEPFRTLGLDSAPIGPVYFDDCRVPLDHRLGEEGDGARIFQASMHWERCCLFAMYLGSMERQLEQAVAYACDRRQFRKPIGKNQAVSHRIVDMKLRLEAARLLVYRACWERARGEDAAMAVSLAKLAVSEAAVQSGLDLIRIYGGAGVMAEVGVDRALRDALPSTIFSGTSDIQRELVAKGLGL
jgi:L-prolyl-PCP dehydrogenase